MHAAKTLPCVGLAVAALVACGAGTDVAGSNFTVRAAHPVSAPSAGQTPAPRRAHGGESRFFETDRVELPAGASDDLSMRCPGGTTAVDGYLAHAGAGVVMDYNAGRPGGSRAWDFGVTSLAATDRGYSTGIVCVRSS